MIRRSARWAKHFVACLCALLILFLLSAWIGSSIARNYDWVEPDTGVTIGVETNGIHTGIVMPLITPQKDWREDFPHKHLANPQRGYTHVAVSFGERDVFLSTPRLIDVSPGTLISAAFGGDGLIHAAHYVRPQPDEHYREFKVGEAEYAKLVAAITAQMEQSGARQVRGRYGSHDAFYDSNLTYHLGHSCNQWVSDALARAGIKTGWWTPLSGGVMKWVQRPVNSASPSDNQPPRARPRASYPSVQAPVF